MSEQRTPVSPVRIAVIQYDPQVGLEYCDGNLSRGLALARRAAREGANLIVLPEPGQHRLYLSLPCRGLCPC